MMARFTRFFAWLSLLLLPSCVLAQGSTRYAGTQTNIASELQFLMQTPKMAPLKWFASTDKTGGNDDFVRLEPGQTKQIPLAAGNLERLWSTAEFPDQLDLKLITAPRHEFPLLSNGHAQAGLYVNKTFTLFPGLKSPNLRALTGGAVLVATNRAKAPAKWYYQAAVRPKNTQPLPVWPDVTEVNRRMFKMTLAPGEQKTIENFKTPGLLFALSVAVDNDGGPDVFSKLRLLAQWEGKTAVDAPLMALAGQVRGSELVQNAVSDSDGSELSLLWPMPFTDAVLALKNTSDQTLNLDITARIQSFDKAPSDYRFCAFEKTATSVDKQPVPIADINGEGSFVGLALDIAPGPESTRRTFAYLEGDEIITADGQKMQGTGTEDYFSSSWYFPAKTYTHPYEGLTYKSATPPEISAYRFHIWDAIPFHQHFKFDFEHGNGNNSPGMKWNWVAMWYQKPPLSVPVDSSHISEQGQATGARGNSWMIVAAAAALALTIVGVIARSIIRATPRP